MYSAADLKKGLKIEIDGDPYVITDFDFCKPGKGTALYRCKLKNMINGSTMDRTFRPVDKVGKPDLEEREMYYSYVSGDDYMFSDAESYEEISKAFCYAASEEAKRTAQSVTNPYGDGNTSKKIVAVIRDFLKKDNIKLQKKFYDVEFEV